MYITKEEILFFVVLLSLSIVSFFIGKLFYGKKFDPIEQKKKIFDQGRLLYRKIEESRQKWIDQTKQEKESKLMHDERIPAHQIANIDKMNMQKIKAIIERLDYLKMKTKSRSAFIAYKTAIHIIRNHIEK